MSKRLAPVTIINHVSVEMPASPVAVWARICSDYLVGDGFKSAGFAVQPLDDPSAVFGGYRLRLERDGSVDERRCYVSELDQEAKRLSLFVDFLSVPGGFTVCVTYQARETATGTCFVLDSHTRTTVTPPPAWNGDLQAVVAELTGAWDAALRSHLEGLRKTLTNSAASGEGEHAARNQ